MVVSLRLCIFRQDDFISLCLNLLTFKSLWKYVLFNDWPHILEIDLEKSFSTISFFCLLQSEEKELLFFSGRMYEHVKTVQTLCFHSNLSSIEQQNPNRKKNCSSPAQCFQLGWSKTSDSSWLKTFEVSNHESSSMIWIVTFLKQTNKLFENLSKLKIFLNFRVEQKWKKFLFKISFRPKENFIWWNFGQIF